MEELKTIEVFALTSDAKTREELQKQYDEYCKKWWQEYNREQIRRFNNILD